MSLRYDLVIFDLDGTLLDTTEGILSAVRYTIQKSGLPELPEEKLLKFIGPPIQNSFQNAYGIHDLDKLQELATIFRNRYKDHDLFKAVPYTGIFEACDALQKNGVHMKVATYKREDYAREIMQHFGFTPYMNAIWGSDHYNKLKKADIIRKCLKSDDGKEYQAAVMIGDTILDAEGAKNEGIDFIGVTYGFGFKEKEELETTKSIGLVRNPAELLDFIL